MGANVEAPSGFVLYEPASKRKGATIAMREALAHKTWTTFDIAKEQQRNVISALQRYANKAGLTVHIATTDTQIAVCGG